MITMYKFDKIRDLLDQGLSCTAIGRKLGIHRKTVARYRDSNTPPRYSPRKNSTRENPAEAFEAQITVWAEEDSPPSSTSIHSHLRKKGYDGSLRTIQRRVAEIKDKQPKERFFEQKYEPAEQSQWDFKENMKIKFKDGIKTLQIFLASLPHCGRYYAKGFSNKTYEAFADGFHSFFEEIGGMTENVRIDNLSPAVKKILKGSDRIYTAQFEKAIQYYGFKVLPCQPAKPTDKGDVERDIRSFASSLRDTLRLEGLVFADIDEFNAWLKDFCYSQMSKTSHELFEKEKVLLKPLPPRDEEVLCKVLITPVSRYGSIRFGKSTYSLPDHSIGKDVKVIVTHSEVLAYHIGSKIKLIGRHMRMPDGEHSILLEHIIPSLVRKPGAMIRWAHRHILFPKPIFENYYKYLRHLNPETAERNFLRSINLIQYVHLHEIEVGIELVLEMQSKDPYQDISALVLSGGHRPTTAEPEQPKISTDLTNYNQLIPNFMEKNIS